MDGPTSHSFTAQRTRLHYVDWGNADKPLLILVHGGQDHCRNWDWTARALRADWHIVAPDLRGHGDSEWNRDGNYQMHGWVYDLAQLIGHIGETPVTLVGHSLGGNIVLRYTGLYPANVRRCVAIEGLGPSPRMLAERMAKPFDERTRRWIGERRAASARLPRRYPDLEAALARMKDANAHLCDAQARHLTEHALRRNEDGSWSWKFDPYLHLPWAPDVPQGEIEALWGRIECPTLLLYGSESWASNPAEDGRARHFRNAEVKLYDGAGHWLHHDQTERFVADLRAFL